MKCSKKWNFETLLNIIDDTDCFKHWMRQRRSVATLQVQPNFWPGWFQLTHPRILMLLPQLNASLFVDLRESNRKYEPFGVISPGISVVDTCGEIHGCGDSKPGLPSGDKKIHLCSTNPIKTLAGAHWIGGQRIWEGGSWTSPLSCDWILRRKINK